MDIGSTLNGVIVAVSWLVAGGVQPSRFGFHSCVLALDLLLGTLYHLTLICRRLWALCWPPGLANSVWVNENITVFATRGLQNAVKFSLHSIVWAVIDLLRFS